MSFSCSDFQEAIVAALDLGPAIEKRYAEDETLTDDDGPAIAAELAANRIAELRAIARACTCAANNVP